MTTPLSYTIRPAVATDEPFLMEMLYQSLFVEEGQEPFQRDVLQDTSIARYVRGWGRKGDFGFVTIDTSSRQPVGAVWCRLWSGDDSGFAYLDAETPELGIALLPEYRGQGIGTALLEHLLAAAKDRYPALSLSVSPNNPAVRLYERHGFQVVEVRGTQLVMAVRFE